MKIMDLLFAYTHEFYGLAYDSAKRHLEHFMRACLNFIQTMFTLIENRADKRDS